ncbi:MAG: cytochrome c oxidase assembly protein [Chromatiales bacterium]
MRFARRPAWAARYRVSMHPGEVRTVDFYAENESRNPILGRAVSGVAPGEAAQLTRGPARDS